MSNLFTKSIAQVTTLCAILQGCTFFSDEKVISVTAAGTQTCAVVESGSVFCWGQGEALGTGKTYQYSGKEASPVRLENLTNVKQIDIDPGN